MVDLLTLEKSFILSHIKVGDTAIDFTMGNGNDTLYLSNAVGEKGKVFAFDIQEQAIKNTSCLLKKSALFQNYTLIKDSHSNLLQYIKEPFKVGMFNLGYLPGGNKLITSQHVTTLEAVKVGVSMLLEDGIILIAIYPGHAEGEIEGNLLSEQLSRLERKEFCVSQFKILNSVTSPYFIAVEKK